MICEKCGGACYLADVKLIILMFGLFRHRHGYGLGVQGLQKTFKCLKCGTEIEVPPRPQKHPEGRFVSEGEMLVWKPGKKEKEAEVE